MFDIGVLGINTGRDSSSSDLFGCTVNYHIAEIYEVADLIRPGDVFAFSGKGLLSEVVRLVTHSIISHVGIAMGGGWIAQSTSLDGNSGVFESPLAPFIDGYNGLAWWLPLSDDIHRQLNKPDFLAFLRRVDHEPYNLPGAIEAALRLRHCTSDYSDLFCSELDAAAIEAGGVPLPMRPEFTLPCDLCRFPIFGSDYWQVGGEPTEVDF